MTDEIDEATLVGLKRRHHERMKLCDDCLQEWPCPTTRLIDDLRSARAKLAEAEERARNLERIAERMEREKQ